MTKEQLQALESDACAYFLESRKLCFRVEDRQEELDGILSAYEGLNTASAQILRQYFLNGGAEA